MNKLKSFFAGKSIGFYCSIAAVAALIVGLICFGALTGVSEESSENSPLVIGLGIAAAVLCALAAVKDYKRILSLVALVLVSFMFFNFIGGRVSYLAYYFSGDILGTGLSAYFVISAIFFLIALVAGICAVCFKQEKIKI